MPSASERLILDFSTSASCRDWQSIDDRIMGGVSRSSVEHVSKQGMKFSGTVSLENHGGFASIRANVTDLDLSDFQRLTLRVKGDGKSYKLSLRTDDFFDGVSYQATFTTRQETWQEVTLPFDSFTPTHHGIRLSTVAPLDARQIKSFGLFIADGQQGQFQLLVAWIKGFK